MSRSRALGRPAEPRLSIACALLLGALLGSGLPLFSRADSPPEAAKPVWQEVHAEAPVAGVPAVAAVLETRWQSRRAPGAPHDRIQVHRYRTSGESHAALLYLPGTNMNGVMAVAEERHNLWLYLAARGVEVFALDYRTHFVPPEDATAPGAHRFMLDWTLEVFNDDVLAAAAFAREQSGHAKLFVAGFSRGVTFAWALACTDPDAFGGLVALDGPFKHQQREEAFDVAAAREQLIYEGRYATDVAGRMGWETRHALMSAAALDPEGPAQREGFESVGAQVAHVLYNAWRPGALANPKDGFSRPAVLARLLDGYDRWWPAVQNAEGRAVADYTDAPWTAIDDRWGELELPILSFGASGLGPGWILDGIYTAVRSGSEDVTLHVLEGYGHLDVLVGERAEADVFAPTAAWIDARSRN